MAVKRNQSLLRALRTIDAISEQQPIGVSALAQLLGDDRSAMQRTVLTLSDAGWIRLAPGTPKKWELTPHLFSIANLARSGDALRRKARTVLNRLCEETGETAFLAIPDHQRLVVVDVVESKHMLRMAPRIGVPVTPDRSSAGRAVLAFLDDEQRAEMLGRPPSAEELQDYAETRRRGFAMSIEEVMKGSANAAAPILDSKGIAVAAIGISGPTDRLNEAKLMQIGQTVRKLADLI
ncbi:IclR family transcriptional regulator [Novosphingobium malaysiense]|uniref:IclR-ED domain-containing protein n=1 Tax=Novosphingobium malaysiense TaxID=1348853 RepID=A0A0B1ZK18_9SPHN|nr:IclR family transcriptional regulator [Novosphingobium malaysiense]KHK91470.1 hypothetical protein LK12_11595 [Novosphingobium malaysiense]